MSKNYDAVRREIIRKFDKNIKGRSPIFLSSDDSNAGKEGDWLTRKMGLSKNGLNEPDYKGFEMKKHSSKITFGYWSPDEALYKSKLSKKDFLALFGSKKNGRYSWSGSVFPKVKEVTRGGQEIKVTAKGDIVILYSYSKDKRKNKSVLIRSEFQIDSLVLAKWSRSRLENFIVNKYGEHGFFILIKNDDNIYVDILFGPPLNFNTFVFNFKKGIIFLDCGMVDGNNRQYMNFRATNDFWIKIAKKRKKIIV